MGERTQAIVDISKRVTAALANEVANANTPEEVSVALKRLISFAIPAEWGMYLMTGEHPDEDTAAKVVMAAAKRME